MPLTQHIINIDSTFRDTAAYPSPAQYQITLPSKYRNIHEARLLQLDFPDVLPQRKYVYIKINELNFIDDVGPSGVNSYFAKVPLFSERGNIFFIDSLNFSIPDNILQNPIASLDKLSISMTDSLGNLIPIPNAGNDHTMMIQLTCGDYVNNGGGSTITNHGRILGGSR